MGKSLGPNGLAEMRDGLRVAEKILKAHGLSLQSVGFQAHPTLRATKPLVTSRTRNGAWFFARSPKWMNLRKKGTIVMRAPAGRSFKMGEDDCVILLMD